MKKKFLKLLQPQSHPSGFYAVANAHGNNSVTRKNRQMFIKVIKMIPLEKLKILTPLQNFPKNVGDLGKIIVAKSFEKLPKVQ